MKVLVCGSREWGSSQPIYDRLKACGRGTKVIHGNARGADTLAANAAWKLGYEVEPFNADWTVHPHTPEGRIRMRRDGTLYDVGAGRARNLLMLDQNPDLVLAFQKNGSTGTQHTIDEARRRGIPVEVYSQ